MTWKSILVLTWSFLACSTYIIGQDDPSPYHLSKKREILYTASGLAGTGLGFYLQKNVKMIKKSELRMPELIDIDEFELFDREYNFHTSSEPAGNLSNLTLFGSVGLPGLFLLHRRTRKDFGKIGLLYLETMLATQALTDITKYTVLRPRPFVWNDSFAADRSLTSNDRASFFSGHTSASAAASFFFARVFADYFPDSKLKPYVWGAAATLPAITGYLRVRAGKHYPSDVLVGYMVGGAIGYLIPTLHKKPTKNRRIEMSTGLGSVNLKVRLN